MYNNDIDMAMNDLENLRFVLIIVGADLIRQSMKYK